MNTDFKFYLTICGLLVLLLVSLGAGIEMQCSRNIEPTPKSDSAPGSPSLGFDEKTCQVPRISRQKKRARLPV